MDSIIAPSPPVAPEPVADLPAPPRHAHHARSRILVALLVVGAFGVVLAGVDSTLYDLERHIVPKELALHTTALCALFVLLPGWRRIELTVIDALLAAFLAWSAVSAALAANPWLALRGFGVTFSCFVLYRAARRVAQLGAVRGALAGLAAAAAIGALLGVAQAYGADWPLLADSRPPGGTFGNRNFLAHLMAIAMPLFLLLALRDRRWGALIGYIGLFVAIAAVILTRSRAAWLGAAAAMGVMLTALLIARRTALAGRWIRLMAAIWLMAAGAFVAITVPNELRWRSRSPYQETLTHIANFRSGSGRGRLMQYRNTLEMVRTDPMFGVGPGNWFVHYPRVTTRDDRSFAAGSSIPTNPWPSSDWVALLAERGLPALLLAVLAGAAIALTAARRLRAEDADTAAASATLLGMCAAAAITGAFDAVLLLPAPAYFVAVAAGLLLPVTRPITVRSLEGFRRPLALAVSLGLATVLVLGSAGHVTAIRIASTEGTRGAYQRAVQFYPGDHRLRLQLMRSGSCSRRVPHARAAAELMPYHDAPRRALAACGVRQRQPSPRRTRRAQRAAHPRR